MKPVAQVITQLKSLNPQKIILFGSYAYGKPKKESDVDLLLIKETNKPFHERLKEARLLLRTTLPCDLFILTPKEFAKAKKDNPFVAEVARKGKIIYG